ncbi:MAG: hypothetical protein QOD03_922 [Verrucomicrobiota bacterium]|jgi:hypothetical protein
MADPLRYHRPPFEDALDAWKTLLKERRFSTDILWILDENLCFEKDLNSAGGIKLGFQIQFTADSVDSTKVIYHHFAETDARLVFYRLGANAGRSVCMLLCDEWFEGKKENDGYIRRDNWRISFYPGAPEEIEEVTDPNRWIERVVRGRPLSAVDFCMTMAALQELKAHGRVLMPDERFGLQILRSMEQKRI